MKNILLSVLVFSISFCELFGQTVTSLTVIPPSPAAGDSVMAVVTLSFPGGPCSYVSSYPVQVNNNTITAQPIYCYESNTGGCSLTDTIFLGQYAPGNYTLSFELLSTNTAGPCGSLSYMLRDIETFNFTVTNIPTNPGCGNVIRDSVTAGSGTGGFTDYIIDGLGRIAQSYYTDSGNVSGPSSAIIVIFDGGSQLPVEYRFVNTANPTTLQKVTRYARDGSGKITSVYDSTGQYTTTYAVSYNVNGNISSIILASSTGNPDFPASFSDLSWQNGNIVSLNLLLGSDTLELSAATDNKNNIKKKLLPVEGISSVFETATANNIEAITFVNDEIVGGNTIPAGTNALERQYTYNANDDVVTLTQLPGAFDNNTRTTRFFYDGQAPSLSFNHSISGLTVSFTNTSAGGGSYHWDFDDGSTSTDVSPIHPYSAYGTYNVCLSVSGSCGSDTVCQSVIVQACTPPAASYNYTATDLSVSFNDLTSNSPSSWSWTFGDDSSSAQQNPSHNYSGAGTYTVCMVASNSCGSDSSCQDINVTSVGISENHFPAVLKIYPNPFSETATIEILDGASGSYELKLFDITGNEIQSIRLNDATSKQSLTIKRDNLVQGMYFIELIGEKNYFGKLIVN